MEKKKVNMVAVVTMCFIFAMISFVTNMAAPFGNNPEDFEKVTAMIDAQLYGLFAPKPEQFGE